MKHLALKPPRATLRSLWPSLLPSLWMVATAAIAAPAAPAPAHTAANKPATSVAQRVHQTYRDEMAFCASGLSVQGRRVCEQEARAAHAQNLRGALADGKTNAGNGNVTGSSYSQNAQQRCQPLPVAERAVCMMRVDGKAAPGEVLVVPGSEAPLQATTPARP